MTARPRARGLRALLAVVAGSVLLTGCDYDVYSLPLPGGTDTGEDPLQVTVMFQDALDLVPQSTVKVNDVSVGKVTSVELSGQVAEVDLELRNDVDLPDNTIAELRQTSLLGEKFVSLRIPDEGASEDPLESGDVIPLERAGRNPEIEEVFGALSLVLNGGGIAQLKTIAQELNLALEGREDAARSVLNQIESFMRQLDENKADIVDAIESVNQLAIEVDKQQGTIDAAMDELPSALTSLDRQRDDLVKMLQALNELGDVGVRVVRESKAATIETFRQLQPTLTELANSGSAFVDAFHVFLTYPFVDEVVGRDPQVARNLHMGDYTNLSIQLDLNLDQLLGADGPSGLPTLPTNLPTVLDPGVIVSKVVKCLRSGDLTSKACRKVLDNVAALTELRAECTKKRNRDKDVCKQLNALPGLPNIAGLPGIVDQIPLLGGLLGSGSAPDSGGPGLPRVGFGPSAAASRGDAKARPTGPTMGQLKDLFDPALVDLLVPGMVE